MNTKGSLLYSQKYVTCPDPEAHKFSQRHPSHFRKIQINTLRRGEADLRF